MKLQSLPGTIDENGMASARQHFSTIIIDDRVAIDAGCLAFSCSDRQRKQVRDIVLTHTHLDHIAGLPLFIDDLFGSLTEPIRVHATNKMIKILERDIFNWRIYPRFSELFNENGHVVEYSEFKRGSTFDVAHLEIQSVPVNHEVAASGYVVSDGKSAVAITGDTAETKGIWDAANKCKELKAVLVECAFPDEMGELATVSHHLTPVRLKQEVEKLERDVPIYIINLKPMYRERVLRQLKRENIKSAEVLEVGKVYKF